MSSGWTLEVPVLLGMLALCAVACATALLLARRHALYSFILGMSGLASLGGISFGMLPTVNELRNIERDYLSEQIALKEERKRREHCETDLSGAYTVLDKLPAIHRHISQQAPALRISPLPSDLLGKTRIEQAQAVAASLEHAASDDELEEIRAAFDTLPWELKQLGLVLDQAKFKVARRIQRIALIADAIKSARPPQACGPPAVSLRDQLKELPIAGSLTRQRYAIERLPTDELVKDLPGHWYRIDLRPAGMDHRLLEFAPPRYYTLPDDAESEVRKSVAQIWGDVMIHLPPSRRLFVRGRSDRRFWPGQLEPGQIYTSIMLHARRDKKSMYASKSTPHELQRSNADLPNWRGMYLRTIIPDASILQGEDETTATGELILYVNWSDGG